MQVFTVIRQISDEKTLSGRFRIYGKALKISFLFVNMHPLV
jgi:hypothetical protein